MRIENWPIDQPKPYAKNARKWGEKAVQKVADSIREYGWRQPIVVDRDGVIVIGHLRLTAAKFLNLTEVPVHVAEDLTPAQIRGLRLADNRVHEEATWDQDLLISEMLDLSTLGMDLSTTAFESFEIDKLLAKPDAEEEAANACPEVPIAPVSQLGDLWLLGQHRLLCGDSTSPEAVSRLLEPATGALKPLLMVTDPPYGVEYDPGWRDEYELNHKQTAFGKAKTKNVMNRATGLVANDDVIDWTAVYKAFPGDVAYVWHAGVYAAEVSVGLLAADFQIRGQIIWKKQHFVFGRGAYHWQHEPCWYAVRKGRKASWRGDRKQTTIWDIANLNPMGGNKEEKATGHGTQKPVECMRRPILNHTRRGESVFDPFLGSGTTLIAAETTGRICFGLELDPKYVDVIVMRWQELTGKEATLDGHAATFEHVKHGRRLGVEDSIKESALESAPVVG